MSVNNIKDCNLDLFAEILGDECGVSNDILMEDGSQLLTESEDQLILE
jgi:hypothetical protein